MAEPKKICLVHASDDQAQVRELVKQLQPSINRGELIVWHLDAVAPGSAVANSFLAFLPQADAVLVWMSKHLWSDALLYPLFQQHTDLLPGHARVLPVLAGHLAAWETDDFLKTHKENLLPATGQPAPTHDRSGEDAWYAGLARDVTARLGLREPELSQRPTFWKKSGFWDWSIKVGGFVVAVLSLWYMINPFCTPPAPAKEETPVAAETPRPQGCVDFPSTFDSTELYLLITRFEDVANKKFDTECFGAILKSKIDQIKVREKLPIRICYLDGRSPDQSDEAARIRDSFQADFVIWGKLENTYADCRPGSYCFHYQPSETLIRFVGGSAPEKVDYKMLPAPAINFSEWTVSLGDESLDSWIISMYNLKIGKNNPKHYRIAADWPADKKAQAYELRGDLFFRFRLYREAVSQYDTAILLEPSFMRYYRRGIALSYIGHYGNKRAIEDFDQAALLKPDDPNVYYNRAKSYAAIGHGKRCDEDLSKAVSVDPGYVDVYIFKGVNESHKKHFDGAMAYFERAIRTAPYHPNIWNAYGSRGSVKITLGKFKEALEDLNRAIKLNPAHPYLFCNRASVYDTLGQYSMAMEDFDRALQLDSSYIYAWRNRGTIRKNRGRFAEALPDFNKAIALDSNNIELYESRAELHAAMENYSLALLDYNKVMAVAPTKHLYFFRGIVYNGLGQYQEALADFAKVLQMDPEAPVYIRRGYAYLHLKKYKDAIADFTRIIKISPPEYEVYSYRAQAYWHSGHWYPAFKDYLQAFRWKYLPGFWLHAVWAGLLAAWLAWRRFRRPKAQAGNPKKRGGRRKGHARKR